MYPNPGEPWRTLKASDICLSASRRMWSWSRALLPLSYGAWSGIVLLWCFMWAPPVQCWREIHPQVLVPPWQSQTGTSFPLKVGAVGHQGICPGPCFTSFHVCPFPHLFPEARRLRWFF